MQVETINPIEITVSGEERSQFLQGLITNDIKKIDGKLESFILTPQGKINHQIEITEHNDHYIILCSNNQNDLLSYLNNYARLSKVNVQHRELDKGMFDSKYFINKLSQGKLDSNFMLQPTLFPSEVNDSLVSYTKGCFVGQEVVARMKHKQKNKKVIKIYRSEQLESTHLPNSHKVLLKVDNYTIVKEPQDKD